MELEQIVEDVKNTLSEKRFKHSLGVMKKAEELAHIYNLDILEAKKAGIAHDIAKEMTKEESLEYIKRYNISADEIEIKSKGLIHSKIGAHMCKQKYEFTDSMCRAIENHTTGCPNMDNLSKVIFIADKIEENRHYEEVEHLRELAKIDLDKTILEMLNRTIRKNIDEGKPVHKNSIDTWNYLIMLQEK